MASSFIQQIPAVIHVVKMLNPTRVLDIGKGFGKYGFLLHEYVGIDNTKRINPSKTLKEQSNILIDAVEVDADLMLPHLPQLYNKIYFDDILEMYKTLPAYDVVLMIDIIEHINKNKAIELLKYFLSKGSKIIIATPIEFFQQELYESKFENHLSHWSMKDLKSLGAVSAQYIDAGAIYLLSKDAINIRGFGNTWIKKLRRIARSIKNEL